MKKITIIVVFFLSAVFLFSCKTYKAISPAKQEVVDTELADYLNSAQGSMHNAPVIPAGINNSGVVPTEKTSIVPLDFHRYKIPAASRSDVPAADEPVLTKKQERKAMRAMLKKQIVGDEKKGDGMDPALKLVLIILLVVVLVLGLLIFIIANLYNWTTNGGFGGGPSAGSGCYIATMVYGSYDAPEVMVLRRFRDHTLSRSKAGRAFIRWYYSWSPGFVAKYHHLTWLHAIIKVILNRVVALVNRH
jgi:hypothetical protein